MLVLIVSKKGIMQIKYFLIILLSSQCMANPVDLKNIPPKYALNMPIEVLTYKINLKLQKDFHKEGKDIFEGETTIIFKVTEDIDEIRIHCAEYIGNYLNGKKNEIKLKIGADELSIDNPTYSLNDEILKIPLQTQIKSQNTVSLNIIFNGLIYKDFKGFYLSSYKNIVENKLEYTVSTQFEPTFARRAFPCFDEPKYKAKFTITIIHPEIYKAIGNGVANRGTVINEMVETSFSETPLMSTYLVAFAIHNLDSTNIIKNKMDIYYPKIYEGIEEFAKSVSENILNELNKFTNKKWDEVENVVKMDQVVIPKFVGEAMENWGLVTYKDTCLLWDENNSESYDLEKVISTISHQFAHMWFGNLVTLARWDYTWLNEGLATFFGHYIPDQLTKNELITENFERMKQIALVEQQTVFLIDGAPDAVSLNHPVFSPEEILNKFDKISYNKGAAILNMMYHFLGEETFKKGIQKYLEQYENQNVVPNNLFDSFDDVEDTKVAELMDPWVNLPGYPVVKVELNTFTNKIEFTQTRFIYPESVDSGKIKTIQESENVKRAITWNIPITYNFINEEITKIKPEQSFWLKNEYKEIDVPTEWDENSAIIVNIDETGYYRVSYDEILWGKIKNILITDFNKISELNRAQIVDDILNLARADIIDYDFALEQISQYLERETNYYPWYSAFQGFSFLLKRLPRYLRDGLKNYLLFITTRLYITSTENEPNNHIERLRNSLAWKLTCEVGNIRCIEAAKEFFNNFPPLIVPSDLRPAVYCTVIRDQEGDDDWLYLYTSLIYNKLLHPTEKEVILTSLGCTLNVDYLNIYLNISLNATYIETQDAYKIFESVVSGNPDGVDVALDFLIKRSKKISIAYGNLNNFIKIINSLADAITTQEQLDKFTDFVNDKENNDLGDAQKAAENAIEIIKKNFVWYEKNEEEIQNFLYNFVQSTTTLDPSTTTDAASQSTISFILLTTIFIFKCFLFSVTSL